MTKTMPPPHDKASRQAHPGAPAKVAEFSSCTLPALRIFSLLMASLASKPFEVLLRAVIGNAAIQVLHPKTRLPRSHNLSFPWAQNDLQPSRVVPMDSINQALALNLSCPKSAKLAPAPPPRRHAHDNWLPRKSLCAGAEVAF